MILRLILLLPVFLITACSDYREISFNCTGYMKEQTTVIGKAITETNPKVIGVYITESTKTPFNFWKEKTHIASVGDMVFMNDESSINEFAFMGKIEDKKDNFGNEVFKQFFLDRKTNILTTNKTLKRANYESVERFEGACNPVKL